VEAPLLQHPTAGFTSTDQVGLCSAGPGGPGLPLVGMSGRVPPLAVEAVPSRGAFPSQPLVFVFLSRLAGFGLLAAGRWRWSLLSRGGARWWVVRLVEQDGALGAG
jgi:hypothetical protein